MKSPFESEGGASSGKAAPEQEEPAQQPEEEELPLLKSPMVTKAPFILV